MDVRNLKDGETITRKIEVVFAREGEGLDVRFRGNLTELETGIVVAILMADMEG